MYVIKWIQGCKVYNRAIVYFVFVVFCLPLNAMAGFLEMPEITEMPELERKSMLKDLDIPSVRDRDLMFRNLNYRA